MGIFFTIFLAVHLRKRWTDFEYLYDRLFPIGLVVGVIPLGVSLAYILVNFSPLLAILAILAIPMGIVLVTRPQLGLLLLIFVLPFEEIKDVGVGVSTFKLLSVAVFGGALVHFLIFRRKEPLVNVPQNWLVLFFITAIILSNFTALNSSRTLDGTARLLRVLTLYLMVIHLIRTRQSLKNLIWVFLIAGFISALWGLLDPAQVGQRFYGTLGGPNGFAATMVPRFPLVLCLLIIEKSLLKRSFLFIMLGVFIYTTILTGSRGGLLSAILALFLFVLMQKNRIVWFSLVSLMIVVGLIVMPIQIRHRIGLTSSAGGEEELGNSTDRRETYQLYGLQLWQENPILGVGLDGFAEAYSRSEYRFLQKNATQRVAHNTYLEIAVGIGLVGLIPLISLLTLSLYKTWKYAGYVKLSPQVASLSAGVFAAQGGYFFGLFFASRQYDKDLWLLIALAVVIQVLISAAKGQQPLSAKTYQPSISSSISSNGNGALL